MRSVVIWLILRKGLNRHGPMQRKLQDYLRCEYFYHHVCFDVVNNYTDMWGIISNYINFYYVLHETGNGLFAYPKGRPGPEWTHCTPIPCSDDIENRVHQIRSNNGIIDSTKMLVLLSLASNEMIKSCVCTQKFGSWIVPSVSLHHWSYKYMSYPLYFMEIQFLLVELLHFVNFFCIPITLRELTGRRRIYLLLQCVQQVEIPYQ